jgi:carboxyl-terminal processing protease
MIDDEVGYIAFVKFNKKASDEVKNAFEDLKSQGMQKLIITMLENLRYLRIMHFLDNLLLDF